MFARMLTSGLARVRPGTVLARTLPGQSGSVPGQAGAVQGRPQERPEIVRGRSPGQSRDRPCALPALGKNGTHPAKIGQILKYGPFSERDYAPFRWITPFPRGYALFRGGLRHAPME